MACWGLFEEWYDNNGEVTMPDGTRHRVDGQLLATFSAILDSMQRQVPRTNTLRVLLQDINLQRSAVVDLQTEIDDQRRQQAAAGVSVSTMSLLPSLSSLHFPPSFKPPPPAPPTHASSSSSPSSSPRSPTAAGRGRKRPSDDTEDDSFPPQCRRVRLRVISSSPSPSSSPVFHHHSPPSHPPSSSPPRASSLVGGAGQRTTATQTDQGRRRRTVPRTNQGRQTRTASRTDQLIARQTTLAPYLRPFPPQTELWQEPLQPGWGRNGTASNAVRTGVQNAAAAPLAMGPHRRCQNCHCELSSASGPSLLCDLCGLYADRMVSLYQCYLFKLFNHA